MNDSCCPTRYGILLWMAAASILVAGCGGGGDTSSPGSAAETVPSALRAPAYTGAPESHASDAMDAQGPKARAGFGSGNLAFVALDEVRVNTPATHSMSGPDVASLSDGGSVVLWNAYSVGSSSNGLYSQRYDRSGKPLGVPTRLSGVVYPAEDPAIAGLRDGGHVAAWADFSRTGLNVYARQVARTGDLLGPPMQVNTSTVGTNENVAVAAVEDGGYVIAWLRYVSTTSSGISIYSRRFDSTGVPLSGETRVDTTPGVLYVPKPKIAGLADGGYVVTWATAPAQSPLPKVFLQRFDASGAAVGVQTVVNTGAAVNTGMALSPDVAAFDDGGFIVAWRDDTPGGTVRGIYTQRYAANGDRVGVETRIAEGTVSGEDSPQIAVLADAGYVVMWRVYQTLYYADGDLVFRRFDSSGTALGSEVRLSTPANERLFRLTALDGGGMAATWRVDSGTTLSPQDIYLRRFENSLVGGGSRDWLESNDTVHWLIGAGGDDRLYGREGNDTLDGGEGDDFMAGGLGDDTYIVDSRKDKVLEHPGEGHDTVKSAISYQLPHEVEDLVLTGTDAIDGFGNNLDNFIAGNAAANRIAGGLGNDTLDGGGGHDTFVFDTKPGADNVDVLMNFVAAEDTIELDARIFKALHRGVLDAAAFGIGHAAATADQRIVYDPVTNALMYDRDGAGGGAAVPFATFQGLVGNLSAANFVVR